MELLMSEQAQEEEPEGDEPGDEPGDENDELSEEDDGAGVWSPGHSDSADESENARLEDWSGFGTGAASAVCHYI